MQPPTFRVNWFPLDRETTTRPGMTEITLPYPWVNPFCPLQENVANIFPPPNGPFPKFKEAPGPLNCGTPTGPLNPPEINVPSGLKTPVILWPVKAWTVNELRGYNVVTVDGLDGSTPAP